jgi:hypothetical protein
MLLTKNGLCLNATVPGLFLISFEDNKHRPLGAAATVAFGRRVRKPILAPVLVICLLLASVFRVCHPYHFGKQAE